MLQIDDKIISLDLFEKQFCCDLSACSGACCVIGDSGAPIEEGEEEMIEKNFKAIKKNMTPEGIRAVKEQGLVIIDADGEDVTPLIEKKGRCAYSYFDKNDICLCAIEKTFINGNCDFRKPISCYLYPIRLSKLGENTALNYDRWQICSPACDKGKELGLPVFKFLKGPITVKFGDDFYQKLEVAYELLLAEKQV